MKKLLAMLMSVFISMFENVDYQHVTPDDFSHDVYYKVATDEPIDYRNLYGKNTMSGGNNSCVKATRTVSKKYTCNSKDASVAGYWFEAGVVMDYKDLPEEDTYTFTKACQIVCPYSGYLSSYSIGNNGKDMLVTIEIQGEDDVNVETVTLHFENMERWWCCMYKTTPDGDKENTWKHTCDELHNTKFYAGDCLGLATEETTVKVSGGDSSIKEFFSH